MRWIGALLSLACAGLGALQVWSATQRQSVELLAVPSGRGKGMFPFEFAASPAKLRDLVSNAGDSGRDALARCFELGYLVTAGYVFVTIGLGGLLTAVSRSGLGRFVILCGLAATAFDLMESAALRQAVDRHPEGGSTAPFATAAAGLKFLALIAAVAVFCLWPFRTWVG